MPKYLITIEQKKIEFLSCTIEVEAESEYDAEQIALNQAHDLNYEDCDSESEYTVESVEEIND